jgi:hypothetical protein
MGITISIEEVLFLKDFGTKTVSEQDETLLNHGMMPIEEDKALKEFLNINGAYVGLIRGLCDLAVKKKDQEVCALKQQLDGAKNIITESQTTIQRLKNCPNCVQQTATNKQVWQDLLLAKEEISKLGQELRATKEELSILAAAAGKKGILLTKEIGTLDTAAVAQKERAEAQRILEESDDTSNDDANRSMDSIVTIDSIDHQLQHMAINLNKTIESNGIVPQITGLGQQDEKIISPQKTHTSSLYSSIHTPQDDNKEWSPTLVVGIMIGTFKGSDVALHSFITSVLESNNIRPLDIRETFYRDNAYVTVHLDNYEDRNTLLNLKSEGFPRFISCTDLNKTLGKQRIRMIDLPENTDKEELTEAIKVQVGKVIKLEMTQKASKNLYDAKVLVEVDLCDKDFHELKEIEYGDDWYRWKWDSRQSNSSSRQRHSTAGKPQNNSDGDITTCRYWRQGNCRNRRCRFAHFDTYQQTARKH